MVQLTAQTSLFLCCRYLFSMLQMSLFSVVDISFLYCRYIILCCRQILFLLVQKQFEVFFSSWSKKRSKILLFMVQKPFEDYFPFGLETVRRSFFSWSRNRSKNLFLLVQKLLEDSFLLGQETVGRFFSLWSRNNSRAWYILRKQNGAIIVASRKMSCPLTRMTVSVGVVLRMSLNSKAQLLLTRLPPRFLRIVCSLVLSLRYQTV